MTSEDPWAIKCIKKTSLMAFNENDDHRKHHYSSPKVPNSGWRLLDSSATRLDRCYCIQDIDKVRVPSSWIPKFNVCVSVIRFKITKIELVWHFYRSQYSPPNHLSVKLSSFDVDSMDLPVRQVEHEL
jgi:hypothetical protein